MLSISKCSFCPNGRLIEEERTQMFMHKGFDFPLKHLGNWCTVCGQCYLSPEHQGLLDIARRKCELDIEKKIRLDEWDAL